MPVENELKFVLSDDTSPVTLSGWKKIEIRQGYLDGGPRIRQYGDKLIFTYKRWIDRLDNLIEIETTLSRDDFEALWPDCTNLIIKDRYVLHDNNCEWVVDFLKDKNGAPYFILAEVEMPENMDQPEIIPREIRDHIIFSAPKGSKDFTNKRLSDIEYARTLLHKIKNGQSEKE